MTSEPRPERRVWITGLGVITASGIGVDAFRAGLRAGRSPVRQIDRFDPSPFRSHVAAQVDDFDPLGYMDAKTARQLDRFSQFGLVAGQLALADAGLEPGAVRAGRRRAHRHLPRQRPRRDRLCGDPARALSRTRHPRGQPDPGAGRLRRRGAGQPGHRPGRPRTDPVDGQLVRVGNGRVGRGLRCDPHGPDRHGHRRWGRGTAQPAGLRRLRHHPGPVRRPERRPESAARPFDVGRDGFVMGEGAALLVLELAEVAERRGALPYAEIRGYGASSDAFHMVQPGPDGTRGRPCRADRPRGRRRRPGRGRLRQRPCVGDTDRGPRRSAGDRAVLGEAAATVPVSGTKALYGHPLGASGAIEAAICALAIRDGWAPPSVNLEQPNDEIASLLPACCGRAGGTYRRVLSTSFGFGGSTRRSSWAPRRERWPERPGTRAWLEPSGGRGRPRCRRPPGRRPRRPGPAESRSAPADWRRRCSSVCARAEQSAEPDARTKIETRPRVTNASIARTRSQRMG